MRFMREVSMHYLRAVLQALWRFALGFWRLLPRRAQQVVALLVAIRVALFFPGFISQILCLLVLVLLVSMIWRGIGRSLGFGHRRHGH